VWRCVGWGRLGLESNANVSWSAAWAHVQELRWLARNIAFMRCSSSSEWAKRAKCEQQGVAHFVMQNPFVASGGFAVEEMVSEDIWGFAARALE
jgi:hypothetical protein